MEQKRPADIFQELLDYLWNGLGLKPHQRGTGPGGGTLCAGQAADRTVDTGG